MLITGICKDGLLRFTTIGGIDRRILPGKSVLVAGKIPGVIGAKPIHLLEGEEKEKAPSLDSLTIDIGASSGRHILFWLQDGKMRMEEVFRFSNGMTERNGHLAGTMLRWNGRFSPV